MKKTTNPILRLLIILSFTMFSSFLKAQVVPNIDWVQHYVWKDSVDNCASAIDADNNVYVTGFANNLVDRDLVVLKYDSLGNLLWSQIYDNGGDDAGKGIKIDVSGNVYVTGTSYDATSNTDIVTIIYDAAGTQLFFHRYDGGINRPDEASDIKINPTNKNVYIIGTSDNGTNDDITVVSYAYSSGWSLNYGVLFDWGGTDDVGVGLVVFSDDYLACTGYYNNGTDNDFVTFQVDPVGNGGWKDFRGGTGSSDDQPKAIILSGSDVVVCGKMNNTTTGDDHTTFRLDAGGSLVWQQDYDDGNNSTNFATSLVRDSTGNIATTGLLLGGSGWEYHTLMYDSTGVPLWAQANVEQTALFGVIVEPRIAVDTVAHHFYVSGSKQNTTSDVAVYQISPFSGTTKWIQYHDGPAHGFDAGTGISVSGLGIIYLIANEANTASGYNLSTIRLSQTPVYFPIDSDNVAEPYLASHYFYRNTGEILLADTVVAPASQVLYYTKNTYPQKFILDNHNIAFLVSKPDPSDCQCYNDSIQRVDLEFWKSNPLTKAYDFERSDSDGVLNYFIGQLAGEKPDVYGNKRLMIPNIYHNIDLHLYSNSAGLKMYFVVKPMTDPTDIIAKINGATTYGITSNKLKLDTKFGSFSFEKPHAYYVDNTLTTYPTTCSWANLGSGKFGFNVGTYNPLWPLVIQVTQGPASNANITNINWSTYFGGGSGDKIQNSKTDANSNLFVCGTTISSNFPQGVGPGQWPSQIGAGTYDGFIGKFDPAGMLLWTTYFGGNRRDRALSLDINNGKVFCVGITTSSNMPIASKSGAFNNSTFVGPLNTTSGDKDDGFIFQTDATFGNTNEWMTYFGGNSYDILNTVRFDASGKMFVVGTSCSTNLGVTATGPQYSQNYNTAQQAQVTGGDVFDAIIMEFASGTSALNWKTYFGTHLNTATTKISDDEFNDVAFDGSGNIYVVGKSGGINMPSALNSPLTTSNTDGIIVKFNSSEGLVSSRYSNKNERNAAVRINNSKLYTVGYAAVALSGVNSGNYYYYNSITPGYYDGSLIITDLSLNVVHATLLGGSDNDKARSIEFDANGIFYIAGGTQSTNFPTTTPANTYYSAQVAGYDYFVCAMRETFTTLIWSTYLGSSSIESDFGNDATIAIDGNNNLHVSGEATGTTGFPVDNGGGPPTYFQGNSAGGTWDGTITRFALANIQLASVKENRKESVMFSIYPNPTKNSITIEGQVMDNKSFIYNVYNATGQVVQKGVFNKDENNTINVANLPNGVYFVNFSNGDEKYTNRFIKVD